MKALWSPNNSYIKKTNIFIFKKFIEKDLDIKLINYDKFWKWSIQNKEIFWLKIADYFKLKIIKQNNFKSYKKNKEFINSSFFLNSKMNYFN